jgi:hypothetical protein
MEYSHPKNLTSSPITMALYGGMNKDEKAHAPFL